MNKYLRSVLLAAAVLSSTAVALAPVHAQEGQQEKSGEEQPKGDGG